MKKLGNGSIQQSRVMANPRGVFAACASDATTSVFTYTDQLFLNTTPPLFDNRSIH